MSNDDLTHKLPDSSDDEKATQPTITAVFRLLQDLDKRSNARLDAVETRLDALEYEVKSGFIQLGDKLADQMDLTRAHADADYEKLQRKIRQLESKAS